MRDFLENLEAAAERRLDEMTEGVPEGMFRCFCGEIDELAHAAPSSNNPYCQPMCRKCLKKEMNDA